MRIKKTSATTPVQAQVINTYSDSQSNSYSCDYVNNNFVMSGTILYNDSTGTGSNSTISLNYNAFNYDYLEIYYRTNDNYRGSIKVISGSEAFDVVLDSTQWHTTSGWIKGRVITVNGTSIGTKSGDVNYYGENNLSFNTIDTNNDIYITRVIGYTDPTNSVSL